MVSTKNILQLNKCICIIMTFINQITYLIYNENKCIVNIYSEITYRNTLLIHFPIIIIQSKLNLQLVIIYSNLFISYIFFCNRYPQYCFKFMIPFVTLQLMEEIKVILNAKRVK